MEEKFYTFEIKHAKRSENRYADVLAVLGSQIAFDGSNTTVEVKKRKDSRIEILKERFLEKEGCRIDCVRTYVRLLETYVM